MRRFTRLLVVLAILPVPVFAHNNVSDVSQQGEMTCIASNGSPNHDMGQFPNSANPNAIREMALRFCFPSTPELSGVITQDLMTVGVTTTGLAIRPYTAGYYDPNGRRQLSQDPSSGWRQQAMFDPRSLGMDAQNAHTDRSGLYHYHGVSEAYLEASGDNLVGYAPDGFEIRYSPEKATSSWQLKSGTRPTAPGGAYDGLYEEDFEYVAGSGTLDQCNGGMVNGTYTYFATDSYPYFPRCFRGVVNPEFFQRR